MSGNGNCPNCHAPLEEDVSPSPNVTRWVCREACGYVQDVPTREDRSAAIVPMKDSAPPMRAIVTPGLSAVDNETAMDFWANNCWTWGNPGCEARYHMRRRRGAVA